MLGISEQDAKSLAVLVASGHFIRPGKLRRRQSASSEQVMGEPLAGPCSSPGSISLAREAAEKQVSF